MRNTLKSLCAALVATGALLTAGTGHAADIRDRTVKFAFVQNIDNHWGAGAEKFAEIVKEKSGGKIKIKLFPGGVLGGDVQTVSALQGGTVEMAMMGPSLLVGLVKEFSVFDFPFLFRNAQESDAILDGPAGKALIDKLQAKGIVGLSYWEHGFRNLTNNRHPVAKWEDIQGLKIRVIQVPLYIEAFNAMGANAVPLPLPELYTALETGTVDGQENPLASILSSKFNEVQKHVSTTNHTYNPLIVLSSKKFWDKLTADEQKLLLDAAEEVKPYQRKVSRDMNAAALEELKAGGMTVTEVSDDERARMAEKLQPVVAKFTQETDEALVRDINAQLEKIRAAQ
ncbi:TRAP transporter substrate-binding protein (plasmid) [Skermanella rosea]|uniref:TRAP transporter substrate-binding protein n=1 Tax=Skermanella rosea TaxID=1817965 RepID=UPI001931ED01|nr:TRAP transporter substrate-binding protein [Skermanella rosea]UEM07436.1 TRAP transporter substrate-binding protein [Skermanella rosea]